MAQLEQLRKNFDANALEISALKKKIEQLEVEQHRVGIAIEVISALPLDGEGVASQNRPLKVKQELRPPRSVSEFSDAARQFGNRFPVADNVNPK